MEPLSQTLIVHGSHLLSRLLLHPNLVFELCCVDEELVNLCSVLDEDLALEFLPKLGLLVGQLPDEVFVGDFAKDVEHGLQAFIVPGLNRHPLQPLVTLVDFETMPHGAEHKFLGVQCFVSEEERLLLRDNFQVLQIAELLNVIDLALDGHVHLADLVVFAGRVLIVVALILAHVAAAHLGVLLHKLVFELRK